MQISTGAQHGRSYFNHSGNFPIFASREPVTLERVGIRTRHKPYADDLSVIIRVRDGVTVHGMSPIRFVRPTLGLSSRKPIIAGSGKKIHIFNSQRKTLTDHKDVEWKKSSTARAGSAGPPRRTAPVRFPISR